MRAESVSFYFFFLRSDSDCGVFDSQNYCQILCEPQTLTFHKPVQTHFSSLLFLSAPAIGPMSCPLQCDSLKPPTREACGHSFIKSGLPWPVRLTVPLELKFQFHPGPSWTSGQLTFHLCFLLCKAVMLGNFSACFTESEFKILMLPCKSHGAAFWRSTVIISTVII